MGVAQTLEQLEDEKPPADRRHRSRTHTHIALHLRLIEVQSRAPRWLAMGRSGGITLGVLKLFPVTGESRDVRLLVLPCCDHIAKPSSAIANHGKAIIAGFITELARGPRLNVEVCGKGVLRVFAVRPSAALLPHPTWRADRTPVLTRAEADSRLRPRQRQLLCATGAVLE